LHTWEREYVGASTGKFATSDWPGWEKYIGKPPWENSSEADEKRRSGFVYLIFADTGEYKIGSSINPGNRIKSLSVQSPFEYKLIHIFPADNMKQAEKVLHEKFANKIKRSEWFSLNSDDVDLIRRIIGFQNGRFNPNI
jgi:hypothetical protein